MPGTPPPTPPTAAGAPAAGTPTPGVAPAHAEARWRRTLRALNPFTLVFNPVFHREMRSTSRNAWTFYNRLVVMLVLLLVAGLTYWGVSDNLTGNNAGTGVARIEALQRIAPELFSPLAWIQFAVIIFIAQSLTAPAINQERQRRSFPTLAVSPLTAGQIVFGTLAARMTQVLILSMVILPVLLALRVFGGLETVTILGVAVVTLAAGVLAGSLGILCSVLSKRPSGASALAMGLMVLVCVGPPLVFAMWFRLTNTTGALWWILLSPAAAMAVSMYGLPRGVFGLGPEWVPLVCAGIMLGMALVSCLLATALLRPLILREAVTEGHVTSGKRSRRATVAPDAPPTLTDTTGAPLVPLGAVLPEATEAVMHERSREVSDHPVLWRELRQAVFTSARRRVIMLALLAIAVVWVHVVYGIGTESTVIGLTMSIAIVFLIIATSAGAGSITGEVEARTWPVLLTTPLTARQVLAGKVAGTLRRLWIAPAAILLIQGAGVLLGTVHILFPIITALALGGAAALLSATGVVFSLMARKTSSAGSLNFLFAAMLWIGSLVLIGTVSAIIGTRGGPPAVFGVALAMNPVALIGIASEAMVSNYGRFRLNRLELPGLADHMDPVAYLLVVVGFVLLCLAVARLAIGFGVMRWDTYTARRLG